MTSQHLKLIFTGFFMAFCQIISATNPQDGYELKVKVDNYKEDTLFLGYPMGNQFYIKDTALLDKTSGFYIFKGEKKLPSGIYFLMMEKTTNLCELVISDEEEQYFTIKTNKNNPVKEIQLKTSPENELFFDYLKYLNKKSKEVEEIKKESQKDSVKTVLKLSKIDKDVKIYQAELVKTHDKTLTGKFVKSTLDIEIPAFEEVKNEKEKNVNKYFYYKKHYFDNVELGNQALLRTPTLYQKVNTYVEQLTPAHPDSIIQSLNHVFNLMQPQSETFQFYFLHYFNKYAKANLVGYDAITTHLSLEYIMKGKCIGFINQYDSLRLVDNAKKIFPLLIGKKAPDITTFDKDNKPVNLHEIKAKYTILYFYDFDCGHCAKQSPEVVSFLKNARAKKIDVKVITVCSNSFEEREKCWKYGTEKGFDDCINTIDTYKLRQKQYDVYQTPKVFVLDENKIIRSKDIGADKLDEIMDYIIEEDNMKLKESLKKD